VTWPEPGPGHIVAPMVAGPEEHARRAFARRTWDDAFAGFSALHRAGELDGEDLERLAVAAYMVGQDEACEQA
jgi:hypothetical protein